MTDAVRTASAGTATTSGDGATIVGVRGYTKAVHPSGIYQGLLDAGVFALPVCADCSRLHYPPRVLCPHCGSDSLRWCTPSGLGTVYSTSIVSSRGEPPYAVILVDLDEGPRLMSNPVGVPPEEIRIGQRVRVRIGDRGGISVPLFELVGGHDR